MSQSKPLIFQLSSTENEPTLKSMSQFGFSFNTFDNSVSDYSWKLSFKSEFGDALLTPTEAKMFAVRAVTYQPSVGPITGNFNISIPFYKPFVSYSGYSLKIKTKVDGVDLIVGNCDLVESIANCTLVPFKSDEMKEIILKSKLDLYINNMRSISLSPYFTFYRGISVKTASPSTIVKIQANGFFHFFTSYDFTTVFGKFFAKYQMNDTVIVQECSTPSSSEIICKIPSFNSVGSFSIQFSQGSPIFENTNIIMSTYNPSIISVDDFSPKEFSYFDQTEVTIQGKNFFNAPNITVKISDNFIKRVVKGVFVSDSSIKLMVNPFYDMDIVFPREMSVSVSFDGGLHYISTMATAVGKKSSTLEISPRLISMNQNAMLTIKNFPGSSFYFNKTIQHIDYFLEMNDTYSVKLKCDFNVTLNCNTETIPVYSGDYNFKMNLYEGNIFKSKIYVETLTSVNVYQYNLTSIEPRNIVINKKSQIVLNGNWNMNLISKVVFKFTYTNSSTLFANEKMVSIVDGTISSNQLKVNVPIVGGSVSDLSVEVSLNGINFHPLAFDSKLPVYSITRVSNLEGLENNFLSQRVSFAKINGENFINTGKNLRLVFDISTSKVDVTSLVNLTFTSNTEILFNFPNISSLNLNFEIRYPFKFQVGLSLNEGYDFVYSEVNFLNSYPQPIYTAIFPTISPKFDKNITIYGLNLKLVSNCSIFVSDNGNPGSMVYESPPKAYDLEKNSLTCFIPKFVQNSNLVVLLRNEQGELNENFKEILFYGNNQFKFNLKTPLN
jgi:hypothetical protein